MEATYIILGVLFQDDEAWREFRHIHSNASRPQQLMDEMVKHDSRRNSERENGGTLGGGEVMSSHTRNGPGSRSKNPRANNNKRQNHFNETDRPDMAIICHDCGQQGHKKKEWWSRTGRASASSGNVGHEGRNRNRVAMGNT